jgi:hypothetical protein
MFQPDVPSSSGGVSLGGFEQVVFASAGRWKARMQFNVRVQAAASVPLAHKRILDARQVVAFARGKSNGFLIGPYDTPHTPQGLNPAGGTPTVTLSAAASAGALSVNLTSANAAFMSAGPTPGQYFGLNSGAELYLIDSATLNGFGTWTTTFWPVLRSAYSIGAVANFTNPTCLMRFASDDTGALDFDNMFRADWQIDFVERNL